MSLHLTHTTHTDLTFTLFTTPPQVIAEQLLDNALVYAGMMDDPRPMLSRVSDIMVAAARGGGKN
jgi:hypothetical protein